MKAKTLTAAVSYRLNTEELERGMKAAEAVGLANNDLARKTYIAAVECIERNHFRVRLPLSFDMAQSTGTEIRQR